ncbi:uncharacterized protein LOC126972592 [Leptidea sinapis]|uniref:uncharacterized protein LOC126972592 n=1 Tax=Leptidea sinapis TaxID=189913 RepID=UPI0021C37FE2|nr:uncharacterized protein LOC126972592 [Leptidea sinapis]
MSADKHPYIKPPPIFDDLNEAVKEYLLKPERLSIHQWERSQNHWQRIPDIDSLFQINEDGLSLDTTLDVVRDPVTGQIVGIEEIAISVEDDEDSLSMSRAPLPPSLATRGTITQNPFLPAGFEEELQKILDDDARATEIYIDLNNEELGKFLGEELLTTAPGCKESVLFAEDGFTLLSHAGDIEEESSKDNEKKVDNQELVDINLEEVIDTNAHLVGLWQDDDEEPKEKAPQPTQAKQLDEEEDENFLESTIIKPPVELPEIPVLNITSSTVRMGVTSTEWAETIDVSQPVPEFKDKIRDLAHSYPFELDNFQKQSYLHVPNQSAVQPEVQRLQQDVRRGGPAHRRPGHQRDGLVPGHDHRDPALHAV